MPIIDVHCHYGMWEFPIPGCGTVDNLLRLCERYDIRYALTSSSEAIVYDMRRGNEALAEALAADERLLGYVYCHPRHLEASCREMETYLPLPQFVGVKIHPSYAQTPLGAAQMDELMAEVAKRAKLALVHTFSAADAAAMDKIAERFPELNIIMAHACGPHSAAAADVAANHPNLYLDFCCSHAIRGRVEYALSRVGTRQIVFGSDMDLLDPAFTMGMFEEASLSREQREEIFFGNAARLLAAAGFAIEV